MQPEEEEAPPIEKTEPKKTQPTFASFAAASPFKATSTPAKSVAGGFGSFSTTANPFSAKKPPSAGPEEPEAGPSKKSFGDILSSASKDNDGEEAKVQMTEQEGELALDFSNKQSRLVKKMRGRYIHFAPSYTSCSRTEDGRNAALVC